MWLPTMLLALMASGSACPGGCECSVSSLACRGDISPLPGALSGLARGLRQVSRVSLAGLDEDVVVDFLGKLDNAPYIEALELVNDSLRTFNVSWRGLGNLHLLDLSGNAVEHLSAGVFRDLKNLAWLRLRGNLIVEIAEAAFSGLDILEYLDLGDNRLRVLAADWFHSPPRLRELDVSSNNLTRATPGALQPLPGLSVLRLEDNPIPERDLSLLLGTGRRLETVDASRVGLVRVPVTPITTVRVLRLSGNAITSVRGGDLDGYPLLHDLDLAGNRIADAEDDALGRLEALHLLDLSDNRLPCVPRSLPAALRVLRLAGNAIRVVRGNDLPGLYELRNLSLQNNAISAIEDGAFSQLTVLLELDISDNPIKALTPAALAGPNSLAVLRMSGLGLLLRSQRPGDMAFPVQTPERLVHLDVSRSATLATLFLADDAALSACRSLLRLDLTDVGISTLRPDLAFKAPQLRALGLSGNRWNCSGELRWLGDWLRIHEEIGPRARCDAPRPMSGKVLTDMAPLDPGPRTTPKPRPRKKKRGGKEGSDPGPRTIAEELNRSRFEGFPGGAHPGMLVLVGVALGAAAMLALFLSRRASARDRYHRHENIEVHSLAPTLELW